MQIPVDTMINITRTCWTIMVLFWFVAAFGNKRTVRRERDFTRLFYVLVLISAFTILLSNQFSSQWLEKPFLFQQYGWKFFGFILCLSGLAFAIWARTTLGSNWSGTVTVKENHELVQAGPYRISRNPIYTGIITAFFGDACLYGHVKSYLAVVLLFCAFLYKISREEKFMVETFGDRYIEYCRKVKRIIPFVY